MVVGLIGLYLIATIIHLYVLLTGRRTASRLGMGALVAGFILHSSMLAFAFFSLTALGWSFWLSTLAWIILLLYLIVFVRYREMALGGFAVPAAFILEGYASAFPGVWGAGSFEVQGYLLKGHAFMALLSMGSFFLLFVTSLMYFVQSYQLKSRRPGAWLHRLPSLDVLDDLNHKILYFGFVFLTSSLLIGSMWARSRSGTYWSLDPVRTWPLFITWAGYGILLVCRLTRSWKGKRSAVFSMAAFVVVLFAVAAHF